MIKKNVLLLIAAVLLTNGCMHRENETSSVSGFTGYIRGYEFVEYTSDEELLVLISDLFGGGEEYLYKKIKWGEEVRVGPTQDEVCGFIKYDEDEFAKFLSYNDYYADTPYFPDGINEKDIVNEELDWNYSPQLNKIIKGNRYLGRVLVDFSNHIVYFFISR